MKKVLTKNFFDRPTIGVAKGLLGKFLVRKIGRREISRMITEVEAYIGPQDKASHASRGRTERTSVMFDSPGRWYVYLVYGMHYCLNIVTEKESYPAAVLIRAVEGVYGPGRVSKHFRVGKALNNKLTGKETGLWIEDRGIKIHSKQIHGGKRIGVDYAGRWKNKPWRFFMA